MTMPGLPPAAGVAFADFASVALASEDFAAPSDVDDEDSFGTGVGSGVGVKETFSACATSVATFAMRVETTLGVVKVTSRRLNFCETLAVAPGDKVNDKSKPSSRRST